MSNHGIPINELIREINVLELQNLINEKGSVDIVRTYMRPTSNSKDEFRAVYRIGESLYDSIHLFSVKTSEIEDKGLIYQILEPNNHWGKAKSISESLELAIQKASMINDSKEAVEAIMVLWNTIADDYVLVRKDSLGINEPEPEIIQENQEDQNLINWYKKGWHRLWSGAKYSKTEIVSENELENKSFHLGATEFIAGDDVSVLDLKTNDEIINVIKS